MKRHLGEKLTIKEEKSTKSASIEHDKNKAESEEETKAIVSKEKTEIKKTETTQKKISGPFEWVEYKPKEIEEVIINLANSGKNPSEIGMTLRDQYGIPQTKKIIGKKIEQFLAQNNFSPEVPQDLLNLIKKSVMIEKHSKENKKDMTAKRGFQLTVSKIRKLVKYYHKKGILPKDWKYTSERAALLIK